MMLTISEIYLSFANKQYREFIMTNVWLYILFAVLTLVIVIVLSCYKSVARTVPLNYILLFSFTVAEAYIVSTSCV